MSVAKVLGKLISIVPSYHVVCGHRTSTTAADLEMCRDCGGGGSSCPECASPGPHTWCGIPKLGKEFGKQGTWARVAGALLAFNLR